MKRIHILVEGQTEETFVRTVLSPYFYSNEIYITFSLVSTKRVKSGPDFKGGIVNYGKVKFDLKRLLSDSSLDCVTTMIDYYHLPSDFPGFGLSKKTGPARAKFLEKEFGADINNRKFLPYFQIHEFEALMFVSPKIIAKTFTAPEEETKLQKIRDQFFSPEEINEGPDTAPSKRLLKIFPRYQKPLFGTLVTERIGLGAIRAECKHFDEWITKLEN